MWMWVKFTIRIGLLCDALTPFPHSQVTSFSNLCYQDKRTSRVCLDSAEEMHILADHLYASGYRNGSQFWSAGHRWPGDMRFYWNYFGRARAINYTNWLGEEPTPGMGRNCMLLRLQLGQLFMESASCLTPAVDICEQTLTNEPTIMHWEKSNEICSIWVPSGQLIAVICSLALSLDQTSTKYKVSQYTEINLCIYSYTYVCPLWTTKKSLCVIFVTYVLFIQVVSSIR